MTCPCGRPLSVVWALYGEVWRVDGRFYCCRTCALAVAPDPVRVGGR